MQVIKKTAPYIRKETSTKRMMTDVLIALIPVVLFSFYRFGVDALFKLLVSIVIIVGIEVLWYFILEKKTGNKDNVGKRLTINNVTAPLITAVIYAMLLPNKMSLYVTAVGALFAIVVVKLLFGGLGSNIFNPATAGRIFITVALTAFFANAYTNVDGTIGQTILSSKLQFDQLVQTYSLKDLFLGHIAGALGEVSALAILIGAVYLLFRKAADYRIMLSGLVTFIVLTMVVGLTKAEYKDVNVFKFTLYQLLSGGFLFSLVFMITDPVTSPITRFGRIIFAGIFSTIVVLIRNFGGYPEGVAFGILIVNSLVPLLDYRKWATNVFGKKQILTLVFLFVLAIFVTALGGLLS